jgi:hypothetical protein
MAHQVHQDQVVLQDHQVLQVHQVPQDHPVKMELMVVFHTLMGELLVLILHLEDGQLTVEQCQVFQ